MLQNPKHKSVDSPSVDQCTPPGKRLITMPTFELGFPATPPSNGPSLPMESSGDLAITPLTRKQPTICDKVCMPARSNNSEDIQELQCSAFVTIKPYSETYVCIHDILTYISEKTGTVVDQLKWKHYNDHNFLVKFQDKLQRDMFLNCNRTVLFGDTCVKFKGWPNNCCTPKIPFTYKVWLKLHNLPIEHYCKISVQFLVSKFGRLHKCNMERKAKFVGNFQVMVDVHDLKRNKNEDRHGT